MKKIYCMLKKIILFSVIIVLVGRNDIIGQALVGSLPGVVDVSPGGAATYSIPIEVVPGTQNMQPNLSIVYNSQAGNGMLGYKWDISGLSSISRVGQTLYHDGNVTGIQLNGNDKFSLDGTRLIYTNRKVAGGEGGAEIENFAQITYHNSLGNGPEYFKVVTSDGTVVEYGNTNDSRQILGTTAAVWMISRITDVHGNYMTFTYENNGGSPWIKEINYTGNTAAGLSPYAKVSFSYQNSLSRKDDDLYMGGYRYKKTLTLEKITISYQSSVVREYGFMYTRSSKYDRLSQIELIQANTAILNPTTIIWGEETSVATIKEFSIRPLSNNITGDFNGDGFTDILYYDGSSFQIYKGDINGGFTFERSWTTPRTDRTSVFALDIDGDGQDEFFYRHDKKIKYCYFGSGITYHTLPGSEDFKDLLVGDFNGDGKKDIAITKIEGGLFKRLYVYTDVTSAPKKQNNMLVFFQDILLTFDYNGDGKTDIQQIRTSPPIDLTKTNTIWEYSNADEQFTQFRSSGFPVLSHQCYYGDFNGDGIQDILTYSINNSWEIRLGKGNGQYSNVIGNPPLAVLLNFSAAHTFTGQVYHPIIADFDGDGRDDILQVVWGNEGNYHVRVNLYLTRSAGEGKYNRQHLYVDVRGIWTSITNDLFGLGDFNNDGKLDLIYRSRYYISFHNGKESGLVKRITDGMNVETEFDYTYLTYDRKSIRNRVPYPVVLKLKQSNGLGSNMNPVEFAYKKPCFNFKRRSFLGFEWFMVTKDGIKTEYTFEKKPEYETMALRNISTYNGDNELIGQQENTVQFLSFDNKRYLMYNSLTVNKDLLNNSYQYTERYLYQSGDYKGRDREVITGVKSTNSTSAPYFTKQVSTMTYRTFDANGKRLIQPVSVITKTSMQGSNLEKEQRIVYNYISNSMLLANIDNWNPHSYDLKEFRNYNTFGIPCEIYEYASNSADHPVVECVYDSKGRFVLEEKTQRTDVVRYTYDDKTGNVLSVKDINNLTTSYQYDALGRKIKTVFPDGTEEIIRYFWTKNLGSPVVANAAVMVTSQKTGMSQTEVYYDKLGRELFTNSIKGKVETRYNSLGQVDCVSNPHDHYSTEVTWQKYAYDEYGRVLSEKGPVTNICYSYASRNVTIKDRLRQVSYTKTYDIASRLISSTDPGGTIHYTYSLQNHSGKVCDQMQISAFGNTTTILTDQSGNRLSLSDPDAGEITSTYDGYGKLLTQRDANGIQSSYTYDNFGRITQQRMISSTKPTVTVTYTYDGNGKKGTLSSETIQPDNTAIFYHYDNLMRLTGKDYKDMNTNRSLSYSYSYNANGQIENIVYPSGFTIRQEYVESTGMLRYIWNTTGGGEEIVFSLQSFHLGLPKIRYANSIKTTLQHNTIGQPVSKNSSLTSGNPNLFNKQSFSYEYDAIGRLTSRSNTYLAHDGGPRKEMFSYDATDRLTSVKELTSHPDNSTTTRDLFDINYNQNRIASTSQPEGVERTFIYNHATKPHALTATELQNPDAVPDYREQDLIYTSFNKIKSISEGDYYYDVRYYSNKQQAVSTLKKNGVTVSQKQYAGKAFEIDNVTNTKYHYIYAYGEPIAVFIQQGNGEFVPYTILTDHLGSIDMILDRNGNAVDSMSFDAWGNHRNRLDWTEEEGVITHLIDRGFTFHQHLDVFGLINMGGRIYDPEVAQFLSPDPYVQMPDNTQNLNRYAYCLNSPLMYTDPDGEWIQYVIGAIAGGFSGWQMGKAVGAKGWAMAGYILGGAGIGAATAGLGTFLSGAIATTTSFGSVIGSGMGASMISSAVSGAASNLGFGVLHASISGEWSAKSIFKSAGIGALSGLVGGGLGSYIGGSAGALLGGAASGAIGSALNGGTGMDVLKSALIGGGVSTASYEIQMGLGYAKYQAGKKPLGDLKYSGFRKISVATQRAFARNKEAAAWILDDGTVGKVIYGEREKVPMPLQPNNARSLFHTHQYVNEVYQYHSNVDMSKIKTLNHVIGWNTIYTSNSATNPYNPVPYNYSYIMNNLIPSMLTSHSQVFDISPFYIYKY